MATKQRLGSENLKGKEALLEWCKRQTEGYANVHLSNMTTSWKDGLAFCALVHRFKPEFIDFKSLSKDDIVKNNELAFKVAEEQLGIPALLDAKDLVSLEIPDEMSIMTYVSLLYKRLNNCEGDASKKGSRKGNPKRHLFDILADETYKRRFKIMQGETVDEELEMVDEELEMVDK